MRVYLFAACGLLFLTTQLTAQPTQLPHQDISLTTVTPSPDEDLIIVREKAYGAEGIDLSAYGTGTGPVEHVQSIYFRLHKGGDAAKFFSHGWPSRLSSGGDYSWNYHELR